MPTSMHGDADTLLLLHGDGPDLSTSFIDSSVYNRTITPINSALISNDGKALFRKTGFTQLTVPDSDDFWFDNGDWTIDVWVKMPTPTSYNNLVSQVKSDQTSRWAVDISQNGLSCYFDDNGTLIGYFDTTANIVDNEWTHLAFVRSGSNAYIFINGISQSVTLHNAFSSVPNMDSYLSIGAYGKPGGDNWFGGWMKNFRITKGLARWTSNFTPPTTYLSDEYTKLLLLFNGNVRDSSVTNKVVTNVNNVKTVFSGIVSSNHDGGFILTRLLLNQYLGVAHHSDFNIGSSDFTIDFWFQWTTSASMAGNKILACKWDDGGSTGADEWISWYDGSTQKLLFGIDTVGNGSGFVYKEVSFSPTIGFWYHIAFARNGNDLLFFINGVLVSTQDITGWTAATTNAPLGIFSTSYGNLYSIGGLCNFRFTKGIARWTSNFTTTFAISTDSDTKLLLEFNGNVNDTSGTNKTVTAYNGLRAIYADMLPLAPYDGGAIYCDGSSYLSVPSSADFDFLSGDFTMEFFFKLDQQVPVDYHYTFLIRYQDSSNVWFLSLYNDRGLALIFHWYGMTNGTNFNRQYSVTLSTISATRWYHAAIVKTGNSALDFYINGTGGAMSGADNPTPYSGSGILGIGGNVPIYGTVLNMQGHIDELRISNTPRYSGNFTAPIYPFSG